MTDYRRRLDLARAYLLVPCPRCQAWRGGECRTSTGNDLGRGHRDRVKAIEGWSDANVLADWKRFRDEQAARRDEWQTVLAAGT